MRNRIVLMTSCVAVASFLAGCSNPPGGGGTGSSNGGGGSSSGGSSTSSGGGGSVSAFYADQYLPAVCAFEERCVAQRGRTFADPSTCLDTYRTVDLAMTALLGKTITATFDALYTLDGTQAAACLQGVQSAACNLASLDDIDACRATLRPRNPIALGAQCEGPGQENARCDVGLACGTRQDKPGCKRCVTQQPEGLACQQGADCVSGLCVNGHCGPKPVRRALDAGCSNATGECLGNLVCTGAAGSRTCKVPAALDEACGTADFDLQCRRDLRCSPATGRCVLPLGDGVACSSTSTDCAHLCVFSAADLSAGSCRPFAELPAAGSTCAFSSGVPVCAGSAFAQRTTSPTGCVCTAPLSTGTACTTGYQCAESHCISDQCGPLLAANATCAFDSDCASDVCGGAPTRSCQAPRQCN